MKYKELDYKVLEDRIYSVLEENGDTGVEYHLLNRLDFAAEFDLRAIFDFAERYGVSIDYLTGRTDKSWL